MNKTLPILILSASIASCVGLADREESNVVEKIDKNNPQKSFITGFKTTGSVESNYKKAVDLINSGHRADGVNILQTVVNNFPDYPQAKLLLDKLESPFSISAETVEEYIENWINKPSDIPEFSLVKPVIPNLPVQPVVIKNEFETTSEFNLRVSIAEKEYQTEVKNIKNAYEKSVDVYNDNVDSYNAKIDWERKSRAEKVPAMRKRYLDIAFSEVLGNPDLESLNYDADNEVFYGKIVSAYGNLLLNVKIPVILSKAKAFKDNINNIKPVIKIDLIDGNVVFSKVTVSSHGVIYDTELMDAEKILSTMADVTIGETGIVVDNLNINTINPLKVKQISKDNRQFFIPKI